MSHLMKLAPGTGGKRLLLQTGRDGVSQLLLSFKKDSVVRHRLSSEGSMPSSGLEEGAVEPEGSEFEHSALRAVVSAQEAFAE